MSERAAPILPSISVAGTPFQRGRQYGCMARDRVRRSVEAYRRVFLHYASLDWPTVVRHASRYEPAIAEFSPSILEEMRGIAEGAMVGFEDVLALNVRSEVMFASGAPANSNLSRALACECTSFAVLPEASLNGHTFIGQNWDWLPHAAETVVLLNVRRDDGPDYVTIVEAGVLAKTGMNASGVAVCTNTLVNFLDDGPAAVPYHVMLRALLDCESISDGVSLVINADKALSANYLLGYVDGLAADLEVIPGGPTSVRVLMPENGILVHTNHFLSPDFARTDSRIGTSPHTLFRLECLRSTLRRDEPSITLDSLATSLSDHRNAPVGVCTHGDPRVADQERFATIVSVIYDLDAAELMVSPCAPCGGTFRRYHLDHIDRPATESSDGKEAVPSAPLAACND